MKFFKFWTLKKLFLLVLCLGLLAVEAVTLNEFISLSRDQPITSVQCATVWTTPAQPEDSIHAVCPPSDFRTSEEMKRFQRIILITIFMTTIGALYVSLNQLLAPTRFSRDELSNMIFSRNTAICHLVYCYHIGSGGYDWDDVSPAIREGTRQEILQILDEIRDDLQGSTDSTYLLTAIEGMLRDLIARIPE